MSDISPPTPNSRRVIEIVGALASGVGVGYFAAWARDSGGAQSSDYAGFIFRAACAYLVAALLTPPTRGVVTRKLPRWAVVAVLGSVLTFIAINLVGDLRHIINFQVKSLATFFSALSGEVERLIANTLIFSLISLPVMCVAHYIGRGVAIMKHSAPSTDRWK